MTRQSIAIDVRDTAAALAIASQPSTLFRLARRLELLALTLVEISTAEGRRVLDAETGKDVFA